jgi:hypothetical protein
MTREQIKSRFPNASEAFILANLDADGSCPVNPQPTQGSPLVSPQQREEARWYGVAKRFEITFTIYAVRPCDYDGYDIKSIQDSLVRAKIIPDDKWSVLSGRIVSRKARTKAEEKTEIKIEIV